LGRKNPEKRDASSCNKKAVCEGENLADVAEVMKGVLDEEFFLLGAVKKATLL